MKLHNDREMFNELIEQTGIYYKIIPSIIEKDYFVTLVLSELTKLVPTLIFKGGTSLSKCYKIINRFSEDIDLTLDYSSLTTSKRKNLKKSIVKVCEDLDLEILNLDDTRSRRDFNSYNIDYKNQYSSECLNSKLIVETTFITKSFPFEIKEINSIIYDFLKENNQESLIKEYELEPFSINVQSLERTFIDKIFALCDYAIDSNIDCHSRHIYDIFKIFSEISINDNFKNLIQEVRNDRKQNSKCYSAQDGFNTNEELKRIIDENIYKEDYENNTSRLINDGLSYEKCISTLKKIVDMELF